LWRTHVIAMVYLHRDAELSMRNVALRDFV